jgi:two-component system cell cycle response regulator DivK
MSKKIILIIEDNEKNLKLMRDVLQFKGYDTLEATTAEQGIEVAVESIPDLILLDIQLPGMNGIEALKVIKEKQETTGIPIIAVTASVMTHDRHKLIEEGFDDYQAKPIEIKNFLERIEKNLEVQS